MIVRWVDLLLQKITTKMMKKYCWWYSCYCKSSFQEWFFILHSNDNDGSLSFFCRDDTIIIKITIVVRAMSYVNVFSNDVTFTIVTVIQVNIIFLLQILLKLKLMLFWNFLSKNKLNFDYLISFSFVLMRSSSHMKCSYNHAYYHLLFYAGDRKRRYRNLCRSYAW